MPRTASADGPGQPTASEIAAATQWFDEGQALARTGKWVEALEKFKKVAEVKRTPEVVFAVGLANSRTGHLVEAGLDFKRTIDLARQVGGKEGLIHSAEEEMKEVRARTPTLTLTISADARPTRFVVDGSPLVIAMIGSAMPLNPGDHDVVVEFPNGAFHKPVKLNEKDAVTMPIDVPSGPVVTPVPTATPTAVPTGTVPGPPDKPPPGADTGGSSGARAAGWVLVGVGGLVLIAGVTTLVISISNFPTLTREHDQGSPSFASDYSTVKTENTAGWTLAPIGLAAAGIGAYLLLTSQPETKKAGAVVVPYATPQGAGASIIGRF